MDEKPSARAGERTIRVFISSTFRDMHAERDVLNRVVFPELRKRCQQRGAEFIGVDMRWGVTEDEAQGAGALAVCLDEIERCRPFFVCLLGDRFGWVPPPEEVPAPLFDAARASGAMPPLVAERYQRDDTVEPVVYRLRRDAERRIPANEADTLARFWETRGLEGPETPLRHARSSAACSMPTIRQRTDCSTCEPLASHATRRSPCLSCRCSSSRTRHVSGNWTR